MESPNPSAKDMETAEKLVAMSYGIVGLRQTEKRKSERHSNMTNASFTISAFGDEIADDLESQLQTLNDLKISCLELRAAWGAERAAHVG